MKLIFKILLLISLFFPLTNVFAYDVFDKSIGRSDSTANLSGITYAFQGFKSNRGNISGFSINLSNYGGNLYACVTDSTSSPACLNATTTVSTTAYEQANFFFPKLTIASGTQYFIKLWHDGGSKLIYKSTSSNYADGYYGYIYSGTWYDQLSVDLSIIFYYDVSIDVTCESQLDTCNADLSECNENLTNCQATSYPMVLDNETRYNEINSISNYVYSTTTSTTVAQIQTRYYLPLAGYLIILLIMIFISTIFFMIKKTKF